MKMSAHPEESQGVAPLRAALTIFAGLREGEVRAIEVRDIDLKQDLIRVRRAFSDDEVLTPKSGNERIVPIIGDPDSRRSRSRQASEGEDRRHRDGADADASVRAHGVEELG